MNDKQHHFHAVDLCSGLGGLSLAAFNLGIKPVASVDICKHSIMTYSYNFPDANAVVGDIADPAIIATLQGIAKDFENTLIVSGPPCQGFSVAGKQIEDDPRNEVLISVANAIAVMQPVAALVENVVSLLADKFLDKLNQFFSIVDRAGYKITIVETNAEEFGVPQRRRRVFFVITKIDIDKEIFLSKLNTRKGSVTTIAQALDDLPDAPPRPNMYVELDRDDKIFNHVAMQHSLEVQKKIQAIRPGEGPLSYRKLDPNKVANTLISGHRAPPAHYRFNRSITVREAARLQGFPDSFRILGSFASQMQQVTNAVPPPLGQAVLWTLLDFLEIDNDGKKRNSGFSNQN